MSVIGPSVGGRFPPTARRHPAPLRMVGATLLFLAALACFLVGLALAAYVWGSMSTRSFVALDRYEQVASFFRVIVASVLALLVAGTGCVFALLCWKTADDLEPGE